VLRRSKIGQNRGGAIKKLIQPNKWLHLADSLETSGYFRRRQTRFSLDRLCAAN